MGEKVHGIITRIILGLTAMGSLAGELWLAFSRFNQTPISGLTTAASAFLGVAALGCLFALFLMDGA